LKRIELALAELADGLFPRRRSRGSIEAELLDVGNTTAPEFPRRRSRGSIEAIWITAVSYSVDSFPRRRSRGSIEAASR